MLGRSFVLIGSLIMSMGCSRLDFAMKWADTFVMSSVTDYFELTSEQDDQARAEFKTALVQVQKQDFPIFASQLRRFSDEVEKKQVTSEKIDLFLEDLDKTLKISLARFEPMAQKLVSDQVKSDFKMFDKEFLRKHDKDLKLAKDEEEQLSKARKNFNKFVDETVGSLRQDQEKEIEAELKAHPFPALVQMESRKAMFEQFKLLRNNDEKRKEYIHKYFTKWETLQTAEYRKARDQALARFKTMIKKVLINLDDKQRLHLVKNFRVRADELTKIAEKN